MSDADIDASKAPLLDHLIELRARLIKSMIGLGVAFAVCLYFAKPIFDFLAAPMVDALPHVKFIYTHLAEKFFVNMKLGLFGAICLAFPVIAGQVWMFVAPGLYRHERKAFLPFLVATPVLFLTGAALVYYGVMPLAINFFVGFEQSGADGAPVIDLLPKVNEYLSLVMTLILAFGACFQLPVLLTLLARVGIVTSDGLRQKRKFAIVGIFALAAVLTPPDPISQLGLGVPIILLYELSILSVRVVERQREQREREKQ